MDVQNRVPAEALCRRLLWDYFLEHRQPASLSFFLVFQHTHASLDSVQVRWDDATAAAG